jgi:hypothetical protein
LSHYTVPLKKLYFITTTTCQHIEISQITTTRSKSLREKSKKKVHRQKRRKYKKREHAIWRAYEIFVVICCIVYYKNL